MSDTQLTTQTREPAVQTTAQPDSTGQTRAEPGTGTALVKAVPPAANPFKSLAMLLQAITDSLEAANPKHPGAARRWVRIVRIRDYMHGESTPIIAKGVSTGVDAFVKGIAYVQQFTMVAYDLLRQGDAVKALFEVSVDFIDTVADPEFINSITAVVDGPQVSTDGNPLGVIKTVTDGVRKYVDKVPEPEDLDLIGNQLYRMLVVVQLPRGKDDTDESLQKSAAHIDLQLTGKLRLLVWGLGQSFNVRGVGGKDAQVTCLGGRRVWKTDTLDTLPKSSRGEWKDADLKDSSETIFSFDFSTAGSTDLDEARDILTKLGYDPGTEGSAFDAKLATALRQFQLINALEPTSQLDNATINQLMHLKYDANPAKGTLRRAKPYDELQLKTAEARQVEIETARQVEAEKARKLEAAKKEQPGAPKPDAPKPDAPKPDAPKPDAPKPDAPKPDEPKPDEPKPDAPKPDAPKPDEPKPDAPKPDQA
nr:peptidoglycan-binding protein [uncultured Rhodopila sp.]